MKYILWSTFVIFWGLFVAWGIAWQRQQYKFIERTEKEIDELLEASIENK